MGGFLEHGVHIGLGVTLIAISTDKNSVMGNATSATNLTPLLSGFVSVFSYLVSYPLNTIRCRMMLSSGSGNRQYQSAVECSMRIIRNEGFSALMKGFLPQMTFIYISNCVAVFLIMRLKAAAAKNQ